MASPSHCTKIFCLSLPIQDKSALCLEQRSGVVAVHSKDAHRPPLPNELSKMEQQKYMSTAQNIVSLSSTRADKPPKKRVGQHRVLCVVKEGSGPHLSYIDSHQEKLSSSNESYKSRRQRVGGQKRMVTTQIEPRYPVRKGPIPDLPDTASHQKELFSPEENFNGDDFDTAIPPAAKWGPEVVLRKNKVKMVSVDPRSCGAAHLGANVLPVDTRGFHGARITIPATGLASATNVSPASAVSHLPTPASVRKYLYFLIFILLLFSVLCSLYFSKI